MKRWVVIWKHSAYAKSPNWGDTESVKTVEADSAQAAVAEAYGDRLGAYLVFPLASGFRYDQTPVLERAEA